MNDKANSAKRVPKYRLHKASGRAVVTLPNPGGPRGRDVFLGRYGTSESQQRYAQVIAEWSATGAVRPSPMCDIAIVELVDRYWAHVRSYYVKDGKPSSEQAIIKQALAPLLKLYGISPARDFGPLALKNIRQFMAEKDWCRNYINKQCDRIKRFFGWAVENELMWMQSLVAHQARGNSICRCSMSQSAGGRIIICYPFEDGEPYRGGGTADIIRILRDCRSAGVITTNLHPKNLLVTKNGVRLIDYGIFAHTPSKDFAQWCSAPGLLCGATNATTCPC